MLPTAIQMMELIVILIIFHNVIFQMAIIVQPWMELVWLMYHIVYPSIIKIVIKIQEASVIIQEIHLLGAIFIMILVIVLH
jgi:hypothetical protein